MATLEKSQSVSVVTGSLCLDVQSLHVHGVPHSSQFHRDEWGPSRSAGASARSAIRWTRSPRTAGAAKRVGLAPVTPLTPLTPYSLRSCERATRNSSHTTSCRTSNSKFAETFFLYSCAIRSAERPGTHPREARPPSSANTASTANSALFGRSPRLRRPAVASRTPPAPSASPRESSRWRPGKTTSRRPTQSASRPRQADR